MIVQLKKFTNFQNLTIWSIKKFFFDFTIWKKDILQYQNLLNTLGVQIVSKKYKKSSKIK